MRGADGRGAGGLRAGRRPRSAGGPLTDRAAWGRAPPVASSARPPCRNCSRGSTRTSHERGGTTSSVRTGPGRWRCSVASTRRARSSPKRVRSWRSAAGDILLANITAFESVSVELWAGDPAAAAEFGAEGCRLHEELGTQGFLPSAAADARAGALRARPARRGRRLGRPRGGARRERRRGRRRCSGGRSGQRCSRAVASTPRQSGSPARRWRSAMRPTCSTRRETRTPTSPRCSCSPASADEAAAALEQALERYERKGNLVSAQRAQARLAELQRRSAAMSATASVPTCDHISSTTRSARPAARIVFAWSSVHSRPSTITAISASFRIRSANATR